MKRFLLAAAGAVGLALLLSGAASAQPAPLGPALTAGEPDITAASPFGYYIWTEGERVHLRTTDPGGDGSLYTGVITTNGRLRDIDLVRQEDDDWAVAAGNTLDFHFKTFNGVDGMDFTARDAGRITFRLYRNGHLISTEHIFLGAQGVHPPGNPFTIFI
jgi:hypothetical protein